MSRDLLKRRRNEMGVFSINEKIQYFHKAARKIFLTTGKSIKRINMTSPTSWLSVREMVQAAPEQQK